MSFLVSSMLEMISACLIIFCFWVSFIFILGNARMLYLLFRVSLSGQDEFKILIELHIARKRGKLNNHLKKWEKLISVFFFAIYISDIMTGANYD